MSSEFLNPANTLSAGTKKQLHHLHKWMQHSLFMTNELGLLSVPGNITHVATRYLYEMALNENSVEPHKRSRLCSEIGAAVRQQVGHIKSMGCVKPMGLIFEGRKRHIYRITQPDKFITTQGLDTWAKYAIQFNQLTPNQAATAIMSYMGSLPTSNGGSLESMRKQILDIINKNHQK